MCVSHSVVSDSLQPHGLWPPQAPLSMEFSRQKKTKNKIKKKKKKKSKFKKDSIVSYKEPSILRNCENTDNTMGYVLYAFNKVLCEHFITVGLILFTGLNFTVSLLLWPS